MELWLDSPSDWILLVITMAGLLIVFALLVCGVMVKCDDYKYNESDENDYGKDPS